MNCVGECVNEESKNLIDMEGSPTMDILSHRGTVRNQKGTSWSICYFIGSFSFLARLGHLHSAYLFGVFLDSVFLF